MTPLPPASPQPGNAGRTFYDRTGQTRAGGARGGECGAFCPKLPRDNVCREPAGHSGPHMAHDSTGQETGCYVCNGSGVVEDHDGDRPCLSCRVSSGGAEQ